MRGGVTMDRVILIKYGELSTKKGNRNFFINTLYNNVRNKLKNYNVLIKKDRARMYIHFKDEELENVKHVVDKIFGIHAYHIAYVVDTNEESIKTSLLDIVSKKCFGTFKIETKRCDKNFPINSQEFNRVLGGLLLKNIDNISVDVHSPELMIKVEIREEHTFIYFNGYKGSGGYPVGTQPRGMLMLSGGIDSSYVVSYLKPDKTFSVGFDYKNFNEVPLAKGLSDILKIENVSELINSDDFFNNIDKVQYYSDEPNANLSAVPLYFLSKLASKDVKVVLSGEGADELFGGYTFYKEDDLLLKYRKLPKVIRKTLKAIVSPLPSFHGKNFLVKGGSKIEDYYIGNAFVFDNKEANNILTKQYQNDIKFQDITKPYYDKAKDLDDVTKMQYLDMHFWLPNDILLKADKMSMANSLELRVPILDKEVFKLSNTVAPEYKVSHGTTKYALRKAASKRIPEQWYKRPKKGFPVPIFTWLKEEKYYKLFKQMFNEEFTKEFFDVKKLNKMLDEHYNNKKNHCRKLWNVYVFLMWYKVFFIDFDESVV